MDAQRLCEACACPRSAAPPAPDSGDCARHLVTVKRIVERGLLSAGSTEKLLSGGKRPCSVGLSTVFSFSYRDALNPVLFCNC